MENPRRGAFIVVEGLDRSGKTTQVATLKSRLEAEGISATILKFPGTPSTQQPTPPPPQYNLADRTTAIGQMIDSYLRSHSDLDDRAIHLLFSANRWELATSIERMLAAGTTVVCDRYAFSGVAFSAAKGLSLDWCRAPDESLPAPDVTIFLDITPEQAQSRDGYGEERYEKQEVQRKVRAVFGEISCEFNEETWVTIDAGKEREEVGSEVWKTVGPLTSGLSRPLKRLWHPQ